MIILKTHKIFDIEYNDTQIYLGFFLIYRIGEVSYKLNAFFTFSFRPTIRLLDLHYVYK